MRERVRRTLPFMHRFGVSMMPPEGIADEAFLDGLVAAGRSALELPFVKDFPWDESKCATFGALAAERDVSLSIHAPYFAVLTVEDPDRAKQCRSALEHTMKLGAAMGATTVVAHLGSHHDRDPAEVVDLVRAGLDAIDPKVRHLGVALGLETAGKSSQFGSLGDIALVGEGITWVRPVIDWAHVHAMSGGALTSPEAFAAVLAFLTDQFPGWMLDPLHNHFTANQFGDKGEIRHVPYSQGTNKVEHLVRAAVDIGLTLTVISESREESSHAAMQEEFVAALGSVHSDGAVRGVGSGLVRFPGHVVTRGPKSHPVAGPPDREVALGNLDKQFFPDGYTKGDLVEYYGSISSLLVPHLRGRAIVMARYPDGWDGDWFYEKQAPGHQPDWLGLQSIHSDHRGSPIDFVTAGDRESLLWLANMGCIEIHPWLSRRDTLDTPDFAIFDLDPAEGATWRQVRDVAGILRQAIGALGLVGYPKLSGATGLHIYVPLDPVHTYRRVRRFVEAVGRLALAADPADVTMEWDIPRRTGKVFIDHNQNVGGKTIASVYSVRPLPGAPVSTPVLWEELEDLPGPGAFTIATIWERLRSHGDLFAPVLRGGQRLDAAEEALGLDPMP